MPEISIHPLTPDRWDDFTTLFGKRGACGGCWCMFWRLKRSEYEQQRGDGNQQAMHFLVSTGAIPGLLAYLDGQPIGWCSLGPRESFPVLERSRILKPVDDQPVWSVVCFFIVKAQRRQGITLKLLKAGMEYAHSNGAQIIEGYPNDVTGRVKPDVFVYTGLASTFRNVGLVEVARRSESRPIMRYML
jgi:GNAT superfamily N-acetyltransferase